MGALQRMAALIEFSEDPVIGLTLEGVITDWNPAAERLYGYSAAEAHGDGADSTDAIRRADRALYAAKAQGRDRAVADS